MADDADAPDREARTADSTSTGDDPESLDARVDPEGPDLGDGSRRSTGAGDGSGPTLVADGSGPPLVADGSGVDAVDRTEPALADRAAYLPAADALVCADLHLGRDAKSNVEFPLGERARVPDRIERLCERFEPAEVVLAGDVLHAFDRVPDDARAALGRVREVVADAGAELVPVAGNHDAMLESVLDSAPHVEYRLPDGTVVCHGDELPELDARRYVIGHDHPAIVIEGDRRPCYLRGPASGAVVTDGRGDDPVPTVLVLPAFNELTRGTVVNGSGGDDLETPLVDDVGAFRPAIRDPDAGETLWFPPLRELRSLL